MWRGQATPDEVPIKLKTMNEKFLSLNPMFSILHHHAGVGNLFENLDYYADSANVPAFNDPFDMGDIRVMVGEAIELDVLRIFDTKVPFDAGDEYYIEIFEAGWEFFIDNARGFLKKTDKGDTLTKEVLLDEGTDGEVAAFFSGDKLVAEVIGTLIYFNESHGFSAREIDELSKLLKK